MADLWPVMFYNPWLALRRRSKVMLCQLLLTDVHAIFTLNRPWFWLAGNDIDVEGDWRWVTSGQVVSFNNWMGGRPNNAGGNQHCMSYTHPQGKWSDDFCTYRMTAFCEIWCSFETMTDMKKMRRKCLYYSYPLPVKWLWHIPSVVQILTFRVLCADTLPNPKITYFHAVYIRTG